jgi:class 3 adenylate cyclase
MRRLRERSAGAKSKGADWRNLENVGNCELVRLRRWSLYFYSLDGADVSAVERAFMVRNAHRYRVALRITTLLFLLVNLLLIWYDVNRFGGNLATYQLKAALVIRLGILLPVCLATVAFSYSRFYVSHTLILLIPLTLTGAAMVAYSVMGDSPGYGTMALFIVYMFSFSPISVWPSSASVAGLIISFGIALNSTKSSWGGQTGNLDTGSVAPGDPNVVLLNIMGILSAFAIIVGFIGHELEYSLRQAFLDEMRLQVQTATLKKEKEFATALLDTMLPQPIILQLQSGRTMIADSIPEVTVLFCELDIETSKYPAATVVQMLNIIFSAFDALVDERYVRKIETVAYVWLGVSSPFMHATDAPNHAKHVADLALGMARVMPLARARIRAEIGAAGGVTDPDEIGFRIGLNSGPVAAGIVGIKNPRYKLIGDTVNTASR